MTDQARYTLEEARAELARRECARAGHTWDVIQNALGVPFRIVCGTCGTSHAITTPAGGEVG